MTTLPAFIEARLSEMEAAARRVKPLGRVVDMGGNRLDEQLYVSRLRFSSADGAASSDADAEATALFALNDPAHVLATVAALRAVVALHESWPVLIEAPPKLETASVDDVNSTILRMSQQFAWATEQEYRVKFGSEPPTTPTLRAIATIWADHPDAAQVAELNGAAS